MSNRLIYHVKMSTKSRLILTKLVRFELRLVPSHYL